MLIFWFAISSLVQFKFNYFFLSKFKNVIFLSGLISQESQDPGSTTFRHGNSKNKNLDTSTRTKKYNLHKGINNSDAKNCNNTINVNTIDFYFKYFFHTSPFLVY